MKILVVEDTELHVQSAREQFTEHSLDIAWAYEAAQDRLLHAQYDVVLTDMMMPKGGEAVMGAKGMRYIFDLLAYGFPIVLLAAKKNVPYIGLVTDVNHHDHPLSACVDLLSSAYWDGKTSSESLFTINNSRVGIFHAPFLDDRRKDWKKVLEVLVK